MSLNFLYTLFPLSVKLVVSCAFPPNNNHTTHTHTRIELLLPDSTKHIRRRLKQQSQGLREYVPFPLHIYHGFLLSMFMGLMSV